MRPGSPLEYICYVSILNDRCALLHHSLWICFTGTDIRVRIMSTCLRSAFSTCLRRNPQGTVMYMVSVQPSKLAMSTSQRLGSNVAIDYVFTVTSPETSAAMKPQYNLRARCNKTQDTTSEHGMNTKQLKHNDIINLQNSNNNVHMACK